MTHENRKKAPRNRTRRCLAEDVTRAGRELLRVSGPVGVENVENRVIWGDFFDVAPHMPRDFVNLAVVDPPYNLTKNYHGNTFLERDSTAYAAWFRRMLEGMVPMLRRDASVYVCSDWRTSAIIFPIIETFFEVRNRITWEREKGRGAKNNWKNNTEDIWFCTVGKEYIFDVEAVKMCRRVLAPYRTENGSAKDWETGKDGKNYRLTHPSNFWSDITVPFWSMAENTDHPTQKPEKLIAKLILASSRPGDMIFDPFLGSGTSAVVAKKLGRRFSGVELNEIYGCLAVERLRDAETDAGIQGYEDGVFWERNSGK